LKMPKPFSPYSLTLPSSGPFQLCGPASKVCHHPFNSLPWFACAACLGPPQPSIVVPAQTAAHAPSRHSLPLPGGAPLSSPPPVRLRAGLRSALRRIRVHLVRAFPCVAHTPRDCPGLIKAAAAPRLSHEKP
jgi:hypothetical protein